MILYMLMVVENVFGVLLRRWQVVGEEVALLPLPHLLEQLRQLALRVFRRIDGIAKADTIFISEFTYRTQDEGDMTAYRSQKQRTSLDANVDAESIDGLNTCEINVFQAEIVLAQ